MQKYSKLEDIDLVTLTAIVAAGWFGLLLAFALIPGIW